jgi:hypothetical protein
MQREIDFCATLQQGLKLSAVSYQLFGFQSSVFSGQFAGPHHRSSFSLLPAQPLSIAALFERRAAIEPEPEILAVTKDPIKQAPNASQRSARKVQLQR